ncbi:MAG TPA: EAL domain-containing protein [Patescibacteria group bacterium]|nr:EAL domain-containing protein [Patescibacteria group bacterium]
MTDTGSGHVANVPKTTGGRLMPVYLVVAAAAMLVHFALPTGSLEQGVLYSLVGLSAVVAIGTGLRVHRPARALAWLLIAASQLLFFAGDILWIWLESIGETPFPSVADVAYIAGYPFLGVAFALAMRQRSRGGDHGGLLDGAILAVACALVGWIALVRPVFDGATDPLALAISAAYPLGDLVIVGAAIGLLAAPGARTASMALLIASVVLLFVADVTYLVQAAEGAYAAGSILDGLWMLSYVAVGAAALHPSMRDVAAPHPVPVVWLSRIRLASLAVATLTGPGLVVLADLGWQADVPLLATGSAVLSLLVLVRLSGVVRALARDNAARRSLEDELSYRATHDPLTGLANRRRFVSYLETVLTSAPGSPRSVLFLDLDNFKIVNDTAGHGAGDDLLAAVAGRIRGQLRDTDLAARLGGDEFGVILAGVDAEAASAVAHRLLASIQEPIAIEGRNVRVVASIGLVDGSRPDAVATELLRDADIAMYEAKARGKGCAVVYAPGMRAVVVNRRELEEDLRDAAGGGQLRLEYQPIFELATGRVVAVEALVRWDHPRRGRLGPDAFIPLAEETGLIVEIGRWVTRVAFDQVARWRDHLTRDLGLYVNLSARELTEPSLVDGIRGVLATTGLPSGAIVAQVTESVLLADADAALGSLETLRALGMRVAVDDFGKGYSSLSNLRRLPVDTLKIDRAFVDDLDRDEERSLAAIVVHLGETLGLETVAEGVERPTQLDALRRLGCRLGQGFLLAAPMPADELERALLEEQPDPGSRPAAWPARAMLWPSGRPG